MSEEATEVDEETKEFEEDSGDDGRKSAAEEAKAHKGSMHFRTMSDLLELPSDDVSEYHDLLDKVEEKTSGWVSTPLDEATHYKTVDNKQTYKEKQVNFQTSIHYLKDSSAGKNVYIARSILPESDPEMCIRYYNDPVYRIKYENDTMDMMRSVIISDEPPKIGITVVKVKRIGPVSPRLYVTLSREHVLEDRSYVISTFLDPKKLKNYIKSDQVPLGKTKSTKDLIGLTKTDLSDFVLGKNLSVLFEAKKNDDIEGTCQVSYLLQCDNGGWIPQWANDKGMLDQHMIRIFQRMTAWLLNDKKPLED